MSGSPHFEIYPDKGGDWRWRLRAASGRIAADRAEGYASKRNARRAIATMLDAADGVRAAAVPTQEVAA